MDESRDLKFLKGVKLKHAKIFDTSPRVFQHFNQGYNGALNFFNMARTLDLDPCNFEMDEHRGLKGREVKYQKIFDTCPGFLQNLEQGPDGALKTFFLLCREVKNQKIFDTYLGIFQNLDQGPDGAFKTVLFLNKARNSECVSQET